MRPNALRRRALSLATLLLFLLTAGPGAAGAPERPQEPPHYESPIVALLFLPVTVLLKIAEVVSPDPAPQSGGDKATAKQ